MNEMFPSLKFPALGRRTLLTGAAAGGLMVGIGRIPGARATVSTAAVYVWVVIGADESVQIFAAGEEMGQGINSGMAQILAEELKVDWTKVTTAQPDAGPRYDHPVSGRRSTGGSNNVRSWWKQLLVIGATARDMLISAAAVQWGLASTTGLTADKGVVTNTATKQTLTYGVLAPIAADPTKVTPPASYIVASTKAKILSKTTGYKLIGQPVTRPDIALKVNGKAIFGIDVKVPGMVFAAIRQCPVFGGTVAVTPGVPAGAKGVVNLTNAVAVVSAESTWKAFQLAKSLSVSWTIPAATRAAQDTQAMNALAVKTMTNGPVTQAEKIGDPVVGMALATQTFTRTYSLPYMAHATLEVMNCTALVTSASCEVWAPTQAPDACQTAAAAATGLTKKQVTVHSTFMGGGLGRKGETDYVTQAVLIAKQFANTPVKLTWSREEDFQHDFYRPMALSKLTVGLDKAGNIVGWNNRLVSPSILQRVFPAAVANGIDSQSVDGAVGLPYSMTSRSVDYGILTTPVPVGFWRSVGNSLNTFVVETAIDEAAGLAGMDALSYRLRLLAASADASAPRLTGVLNKVATMPIWSTPLATGRARGLACRFSFGTYVAEVVEVATLATGQVVVTRVDCAVDCGLVINPDSVAAQAQSAINQGLATAMWGKITWQKGQADQRNFDNFRMMRMKDAPAINVAIVPNPTLDPGGMGEPCLPPSAPALANAYFALTGKRVTTLPMNIGGPNSGGG